MLFENVYESLYWSELEFQPNPLRHKRLGTQQNDTNTKVSNTVFSSDSKSSHGKPSRDRWVGRASGLPDLTVSGSMIAPGFESHQCLAGMWKRRLGCLLWLWNPEETSPEVRNRGISGPIKRTHVLQKFKTKKSPATEQKAECYTCYTCGTSSVQWLHHFPAQPNIVPDRAALWPTEVVEYVYIERGKISQSGNDKLDIATLVFIFQFS